MSQRGTSAVVANAVDDTRPLHILMIVENLPVPFDRRVWQEACALHDAGHRVSVICPRSADHHQPRETLDGIAIHRHPLPIEAESALGYPAEYATALFWQLRLAARIHRRHPVDVIHGANPPDTIFLVAALGRLLGIRYVFDHHDLCPELFEAKFARRGPLYWAMRALERATFAVADVSIATNESFKRVACARGGMTPDDVFVVRSGPDLDRVYPVAPDESLRHGRRHLVGYVGVMGEQEGLDDLLHVIADLVHRRARHDIQFCLVGFGPSLAALKQQAAELAITEYVDFPGRLSGEALLTVLSSADVCVSPDPKNAMNDRSTMNKILEYMALSKPLVQYDLVEGRESAGEAALYARPGDRTDFADKLILLIDDEKRRERMGRAGRQRIEQRLSWAHEVPALLAAYRRVAS